MEILFENTRDSAHKVTASQAIVEGLAPGGGLYVPTEIPALDVPVAKLAQMSYKEVAYEVMKLYLTDFTEAELKTCITRAYDEKFDTPEIVPVVQKGSAHYIELFHGATIAFKDMALSILPHLMITAAKKNHIENDIVILTATSGDTGKAALAGFAGVEGTKIIVFYPKDGVSAIQEKQMVTQKGDNTFVVGIKGNFAEAQTGVKQMFTDTPLTALLDKNGLQFSSANSINVGRLVPQIVYYVYAYAQLVKKGVVQDGAPVNIDVPTGNFGNILAAYYASLMGIPVNKLICASNQNKVLYDFFTTGCYDKNREFYISASPSMDILISSNLERLIYRIAGNSSKINASLMAELQAEGHYTIIPAMREQLKVFYGNFATEEETFFAIHEVYEDSGYVLDPHTAVAASVYKKYVTETKDRTPTLIASTASPYKFADNVMRALGREANSTDEFELTDALAGISGVPIPPAIEEIRTAPVRHTTVCEVDEMEKVVLEFLGVNKS